MHLYTSNRLEYLIEILAERMRTQPLPPLCSEILVVQSKGMERWLTLELAARLGLWANAEYPFPGAMTWRMFRAVLGDVPETSAYDPQCLQWTVMELLPRWLERVEFRDLQRYLADDNDGLKLYQLAQRIADTFDQYVIYRPDWILSWEEKTPSHWQGLLWRAIRDHYMQRPGVRYAHRAALWQRMAARLRPAGFDASHLPARLSIFGISSLPRFYVEMFNELSRHIDIRLYILNPCRQYWGLIQSATEIARISMRDNPPLDPEEEYLESGNPLLASMGKLGRDFIELLIEYGVEEDQFFEEPAPGTSLLAQLQADILNLQDRSAREPQADGQVLKPYIIEAADQSVQIHNCHSAMREVEVLHDRLLRLFEVEPELTPSDILVMTPDIESYAPLIQAVFATTPDAARRIPFSIADRGARRENLMYEAFLRILDLVEGRLPLSAVLELLHEEAIQVRFGLSGREVERLQAWLSAAGVRWGMDADDRAGHDLPALEENTWHFGLQRLLLGYALPDDGETLFANILPLDCVEGGEAQILGAFIDFAATLFTACDKLRAARTLPAWQSTLLDLIDDFFAPPGEETNQSPDNQRQLQGLRTTLSQLASQAVPAGFDNLVSLAVMQSWLVRHLEIGHAPSGFITGCVTFCELLPMRGIPFRVVCLIGLHDRAYPRVRRTPGFDLMARYPRRGDRSRRNDDRYLFLESLLSARAYWYLSYAGQSIKDNSEAPPSVLISELLDYLTGSCVVETGEVGKRLVTRHPLQAFSRAYFDGRDPTLFSYAGEYRDASAVQRQQIKPELLLQETLPDVLQAYTLEEIIQFFRSPPRYLLEHRLGIRLPESATIPEDNEPFDVTGLARYQIDVDLLERALLAETPQQLSSYYPILKAAGLLPLGEVGKHSYHSLSTEAAIFAEQLRPLLRSELLPALDSYLPLGQIRLHGHIPRVREQALVGYRPATVKPTDLLTIWLRHLFINACRAPGYPTTSVYIGTDKGWRLPPVPDAMPRLRHLLSVYRRGLREPVHFFPNTSYAYLIALRKPTSPAAAMREAEQVWNGNPHQKGEGENMYYRRCFRDRAPLDDSFVELAETVYGPLLERMEAI